MRTLLISHFLFCCAFVHAQNTLYFNLINNNQKQYPLTSIKNLTFPTGKIQVNIADGNKDDILLNDLRYFTFDNTIPSGLDEIAISNYDRVKLYPNPFVGDVLTIWYQTKITGIKTIEILDIEGNTVWHQQEQNQVGKNEIRLQNLKIISGIYVCRIKDESSVVVKKLIVNK